MMKSKAGDVGSVLKEEERYTLAQSSRIYRVVSSLQEARTQRCQKME